MADDLTAKKSQLKIPRLVKQLKVKDWKELITDFSMTIVNSALAIAGIKTGEDALQSCLNVAKNIGWNTPEEQLLWKLITRAMWEAIQKLIDDSRSGFSQQSDVNSKPRKRVVRSQTKRLAEDHEITINEHFFDHPERCALVAAAQDFFEDSISDLIGQPQAAALANRLPSYFVRELHIVWRESAGAYKPLYDYFYGSPFAKSDIADREWEQYRAFLRQQEDGAVFGSCLGLSQLYIPLNASYVESPLRKGAMSSMPTEGKDIENERVIAVELEPYLSEWLNRGDPEDPVRVISGGPGAGKSSFAKVFAAKLAKEEKLKVLFIPLHKIDISGNVIDAVGDYLRTEFTDNPLKDPAANLLVILDGLDELTETGQKYADVATGFVQRTNSQLVSSNRNGRCVRLLYTGRTIVVQSVALFDKNQVLSLLPFYLPEEKRGIYTGGENLVSVDYRDTWWEQYGRNTGQSFKGVPKGFREGRLAELTAQPLLNYMVAIAEVYMNASQITNLNELYARLLDAIYRRDWGERRAWNNRKQLKVLDDMEESEYPLIFETIAVAAWHGADRTVSVEEIDKVREEIGSKANWKKLQESEDVGIKNMLTVFYFQQVVRDGDKRFEFTHKSFREYLTAQRIVKSLLYFKRKLFADQDPDMESNPCKVALDQWRKLCAPTPIDSYLYQFLRDQMEILHKEDRENVRECQKILCRLIGYVVKNGLPPAGTRPPILEELRLCRNAETALLAMHSACASATGECSMVDWGKDLTAANAWLKRLSAPPDEVFIRQCLNNIGWQDQSFDGFSLRNANLAGAEICGHKIFPESIGRYDRKDLWWLVLEEDKENQRVLLLALDCVTYREYHNSLKKVTWKECDLRKWLNGTFLNDALCKKYEQILPVTVHTNDNARWGTVGGEDAKEDRLFLLSLEEVNNYFGVAEFYKPCPSLVARLNGDAVWWWLRSPGRNRRHAAGVSNDGSVLEDGAHVKWSSCAVRPAFWLNLES